jgi:hypothetical protein
MSALPNFAPAEALHLRWVRAVEALLRSMTAVRITRTFDGDNVPYEWPTGVTTKPTAVLCIVAKKTATSSSEFESGARVRWEWVGGSGGVIRINAIALTSLDEYDVTLEVR